jgi:hypothetical protein
MYDFRKWLGSQLFAFAAWVYPNPKPKAKAPTLKVKPVEAPVRSARPVRKAKTKPKA